MFKAIQIELKSFSTLYSGHTIQATTTLLLFIFLFVFSLPSFALDTPLPLIEVNGSSDYAYLNFGDLVDVRVTLDAGGYEGIQPGSL